MSYTLLLLGTCGQISALIFARDKGEAMPPTITLQSMPVLIDGYDAEGRLVLADDQLAAVIVRLDGEAHEIAARGRWRLEAGFGKCDVARGCAVLW